MGLFSKKNEGGLIDVIRCDEQEYLVWKWRPAGAILNDSKKENAIRFGSSLRVKEGEIAIFVYKQEDGAIQDYIIGPYDNTIKTDNFPVLTSIIGSAFGGNSPFQAEIYFINLSGNIQIKFGIPYFDIYDPRYMDLGVPCAVRGTLIFNLTDYKNFIKLNRLINFDLDDFKNQIKDSVIRKSKSIVINIPVEEGIPVMQIERKIDEISDIVKTKLKITFEEDFGINLKRIDISAIELDKEHSHYQQLKRSTADQQTKFSEARTDIEILDLAEKMRIDRKNSEMQVEGQNFTIHQLNQQTDVLKTAANSLGDMGNMGGGMNTAGLMTGMMMGGAVGSQMGGMMNNINKMPPPIAVTLYHIALNGQQIGSYSIEQLGELAKNGQLTKEHHIWREGMTEWSLATNVVEISILFNSVPPPPPAII